MPLENSGSHLLCSSLKAYRSSSLRVELDVRDIFLITNKAIGNQQRLEDRLAQERDQDRLTQDQFRAQILAQLKDFQLHRRETEHCLSDSQEKSQAFVDSTPNTLQTNEHSSLTRQIKTTLAIAGQSPLRPELGSNQIGYWSGIGVCADLKSPECSASCKCSCHTRQRLSSPRLLESFLGTLFVGYSGSPLLTQKCDRASCHGRRDWSTSFTYRFPRWFVVARMIQLKAKATAMYGPELSLRFNRMVDGKAMVFHCATTGDVDRMKQLFQQGRASPSDVRYDSGWTPFHVCFPKVGPMSDRKHLLSKWVE